MDKHSCQACGRHFPAGTNKRRKYCDDACKIRAKRDRDRAATPSSAAAARRALQNEQLRGQLSRMNGELAKVRERAMAYRKETHELRNRNEVLLDVRRNSLLHFQNQHQALRGKYRQAHTMLTKFRQTLATIAGTDAPATTTWHGTEHVSPDMLRGPLPSDDTNSATLTQLVADILTQLEQSLGLSRHLPRTRRDIPISNDTTKDNDPTVS